MSKRWRARLDSDRSENGAPPKAAPRTAEPMTEKVWVVDDAPSRRFPIYTRGNVGEVFPDVVSPLSWSAYGADAELGWRDAWRDYGMLLDRNVGVEDKVILGCFGGYCYLNA